MKSELLTILRKLSPKENKKLKSFLKNPYFSHNKNLILLLENLFNFYPQYEISEEDKLRIFKNIYGNVEVNDSTFRSLLHLLLSAIEDFITIEYTIKTNKYRYINFLKFLYDKDLNDMFEKSIEKSNAFFKKKLSFFSPDDIFTYYEIEVLKYNYYTANEKIIHKDSVNIKSETFFKSNQYLALHFFIELVSDFVIHEITRRKFEIEEVNSLKVDQLINFEQLELIVGDGEMKQVYLVYLYLFMTFKNFNDEFYYFKYKNLLGNNFTKIKKEEAAFHYSSMVSYCLLKKYPVNKNLFESELWELYNIILKNNFYSISQNHYLDIWLYRAILFLGLKLQYFDKVKQFIDTYVIKVNPVEINNIKKLSYAYYYYEIGEKDFAMEQAKDIKLTNFIFKYDIKNLLIKIYYELNYFDSLDSIIHTYREFLKNDKILNNDVKKQFRNFMMYVEKLVKISDSNDTLDLEYQMKNLSKNNCVYSKEWLLKKYSQKLNSNVSVA